MGNTGLTLETRIYSALNAVRSGEAVFNPARALDTLVAHQLADLPMPGAGKTLQRWQALAAVAAFDLSLAKLYEGHTDALAILGELKPDQVIAPGTWCVWASEAPLAKVSITSTVLDSVCLSGAKSWCSGAATADYALLTAWDAEAQLPQLVWLPVRQHRIHVDPSLWKAVGMAASQSLEVQFDGAVAHRVGGVGAYLQRPGFWQGGAGVAACWWGGANGIGQAFKQSMAAQPAEALSLFKLAGLGKVALALQETAAVLRESAAWIDAHPLAEASAVALAARLSAEQCAKRVLDEVGKAMGASPFCRDEKFAQAAADLPVFIRQSHAERDFVSLGERVNAAKAVIGVL